MNFIRRSLIPALILAQLCIGVPTASADDMSDKVFFFDSNIPSAVTNYTISFRTATTASIGSIRLQFCTTRFGTCSTPVGLDTMSPSVGIINQFGIVDFGYYQESQGSILLVRSASPEVAGTKCLYTISNITNPSFSNVSFYVRISTYTSSDGSGVPVDTGGAVGSINSALNVNGITPETLSFCIGVSGNSCSDLNGKLVGFGDFKSTATSKASTVMFAATNAPNGYTINIYGSTLASGANTIPGMGQQSINAVSADASQVGKSQFGTNIVANSSPLIGANATGAGIGTAFGGYGIPNQFRFMSGDTVATTNDSTDITKFTNSYIVNIASTQAVGFYAATLSYICTGNF